MGYGSKGNVGQYCMKYSEPRTGTYFASSARANTPAASGAAALVPECVVVHFPYRSVVACSDVKK